MVSPRTNLPSASVFPISTLRPFIALMISPGLNTALPIAFSAKPHAKIMFFLIPSSKVPYKAPITAHEPPLSPYMSSMYPVGLRFNPPVSKVTPFPTSATSMFSGFSGSPS